jgi:hypothetical protein
MCVNVFLGIYKYIHMYVYVVYGLCIYVSMHIHAYVSTYICTVVFMVGLILFSSIFFTQEPHQTVSLGALTAKVVSNW